MLNFANFKAEFAKNSRIFRKKFTLTNIKALKGVNFLLTKFVYNLANFHKKGLAMKKLVKQSKKLGVIALATMSLVAFSACGGGDSGISSTYSDTESYIKKEFPDVKILSFSEIQKEFGIKDKKCLTETDRAYALNYHFAKRASGEVEIFRATFDAQLKKEGFGDGFGSEGVYTIDEFKRKKPNCF